VWSQVLLSHGKCSCGYRVLRVLSALAYPSLYALQCDAAAYWESLLQAAFTIFFCRKTTSSGSVISAFVRLETCRLAAVQTNLLLPDGGVATFTLPTRHCLGHELYSPGYLSTRACSLCVGSYWKQCPHTSGPSGRADIPVLHAAGSTGGTRSPLQGRRKKTKLGDAKLMQSCIEVKALQPCLGPQPCMRSW
jgi:hypothetical protein